MEVYPDEAGAAARKRFIDEIMKATPSLGTEYSYVDGPVLLLWVPETRLTSADLLLRRRRMSGMIRRWRCDCSTR